MLNQSTDTLLMIRPVQFRMNEQTAINNYYQKVLDGLKPEDVQTKALDEFDSFVEKLRENGINVEVVNDTKNTDTPDSIFPNNWVSFHDDGRVGLYPMFAENRRSERRLDIIDTLKKSYEVTDIVDFSTFENDGVYLEGTGSMILDRVNNVVYSALSERTQLPVLKEFCEKFGYTSVEFTANQTVDGKRLPIYHTNVMMCLGYDFAIICSDSIDDEDEQKMVLSSLEASGREVIEITENQKLQFAGNMLQVRNKDGQPFVVMSEAAYQSLRADQIEKIVKYCPILHSSLDTIEALGGGSARCMMAEVFLPKK